MRVTVAGVEVGDRIEAVESATVEVWKLLRLFRERRDVVDDSGIALENRPHKPAFVTQVVVHDHA